MIDADNAPNAESIEHPHWHHGTEIDLNTRIRSHLFILSPNGSGSTLLQKLLARSGQCWSLEFEGQYTLGYQGPSTPIDARLPFVWYAFPDFVARYQAAGAFDWPATRRAWYLQARSSNPDASVFIEKSPPFLLVAEQLIEHFRDTRFLISTRNPYAVAEGIVRRARKQAIPSDRARCDLAGEHLVNCLRKQRDNIARFAERALVTRYEDVCADPMQFQQSMAQLIPGMDDLALTRPVAIRDRYHAPITNMNAAQIARLNREQIACLNRWFEPEQALLESFGYPILE